MKRLVMTFQQAGIFPIVVITGTEEEEVGYQLADRGVVYVRNENYRQAELIDSIMLGLEFLKDKCRKIVFSPVNFPLFLPQTLHQILEQPGLIVTPSYHGKSGHPTVIDTQILPEIFERRRHADGFRGILNDLKDERKWVDVTDAGVILSIHQKKQLKAHLKKHEKQFIHPFLQLNLEKEGILFNARGKLLLLLLEETHSVSRAAKMMRMSISKSWQTIHELEDAFAIPLVERQQGGRTGSQSRLTKAGQMLLQNYQAYEESLYQYNWELFKKNLLDTPLFDEANAFE
ncbi:MAG: LysR family transcriptional regulator [Enterococcaceae bacterium]|nr:LysR family transcriptional regulator [Enterococcaceae bacterium]